LLPFTPAIIIKYIVVAKNTHTHAHNSYSTVLLNVDQHSGKVKRPMTADGFARNNRDLNGHGDFPRPLLDSIFNDIHVHVGSTIVVCFCLFCLVVECVLIFVGVACA
jgi:hypothetical protein